MRLIFSWCQNFHETNESWHEDAKILSLEISQQEGSFASAAVTIFSVDEDTIQLAATKKYAKIGLQTDNANQCAIRTIFKGRITSFPLAIETNCIHLELVAEPENFQQQLQNFTAKNLEYYKAYDKNTLLPERMNFDDLFFDQDDLRNPTIFLESDSKCFYWNMKNGKMSLSDVNIGARNIEIDKSYILRDSIRISLTREPYKRVNITLSVHWIQYLSGFIDLYPLIASKFRNGIICSFTNIGDKLRALGKRLINLRGYNVLKCKIQGIEPIKTVSAIPLLKVSREFTVEKDGNRTIARFKKFYFSGELLVGWNRQRKREENVNISVVNTKVTNDKDKNIHLRLNAIQLPKKYPQWCIFTFYKKDDRVIFNKSILECKKDHFATSEFDNTKWQNVGKVPDALANDSGRSFFETARGKNSIKYALQNAIALLNYSARHLEITFCVDGERFVDININDQITLTNQKTFTEKICGKVIKTTFSATAKGRIMKITIGCSLGKHTNDAQEKINNYIRTLNLSDLIIEDEPIKTTDIVQDIYVANLPEEQEEILARSNAQTIPELASELQKHATKIKILLAPVNNGKVISNTLTLPTLLI